MEELGIISSFNPFDALESISQIYSAKQLSKVEIKKIHEQTQRFNTWLWEQKIENNKNRESILSYAEVYKKHIDAIICIILEKPETTMEYKDILEGFLKANNELVLSISKIRIRSK